MSYTPSDCFVNFPFPIGFVALDDIGDRYDAARSCIMCARKEGVTQTYNRFNDPDDPSADIQEFRHLHLDMDKAVAAAYGWSDFDLGHSFHKTKQGLRFTISEPARCEVLHRLLKLNHERYAEEVKQGLHGKKGGAGRVVGGGKGKAAAGDAEIAVPAIKRRGSKKPTKSKSSDAQTVAEERSLFDMEGDE